MRYFDFSSWQGILATLLGLAIFTLIGVGVRIVMMLTIQQRQQRMNRQINERLRTLIAAYKVLGGSFTGRLIVNPVHLRDLRGSLPEPGDEIIAEPAEPPGHDDEKSSGSDRARRIRDAVEAALSDIILLGTQEQVRLAAQAAHDLAAGKPIQTAELVVQLRDFIRKALDLDAIPADVTIPSQGPTRPQSGAGRGGGGAGGGGGGGAVGGGGFGMGMGGGARRGEDGS